MLGAQLIVELAHSVVGWFSTTAIAHDGALWKPSVLGVSVEIDSQRCFIGVYRNSINPANFAGTRQVAVRPIHKTAVGLVAYADLLWGVNGASIAYAVAKCQRIDSWRFADNAFVEARVWGFRCVKIVKQADIVLSPVCLVNGHTRQIEGSPGGLGRIRWVCSVTSIGFAYPRHKVPIKDHVSWQVSRILEPALVVSKRMFIIHVFLVKRYCASHILPSPDRRGIVLLTAEHLGVSQLLALSRVVADAFENFL